jgi:hypothetical protein
MRDPERDARMRPRGTAGAGGERVLLNHQSECVGWVLSGRGLQLPSMLQAGLDLRASRTIKSATITITAAESAAIAE